jgi:hypothetical protein
MYRPTGWGTCGGTFITGTQGGNGRQLPRGSGRSGPAAAITVAGSVRIDELRHGSYRK